MFSGNKSLSKKMEFNLAAAAMLFAQPVLLQAEWRYDSLIRRLMFFFFGFLRFVRLDRKRRTCLAKTDQRICQLTKKTLSLTIRKHTQPPPWSASLSHVTIAPTVHDCQSVKMLVSKYIFLFYNFFYFFFWKVAFHKVQQQQCVTNHSIWMKIRHDEGQALSARLFVKK